MKKEMKSKVFARSMLGLFVFLFAIQFVVAADSVTTPGVSQPITNPQWLVSFVNFMGFGETWSTLIASLAVLAMIFAAAYDILAFTAFESKWAKFVIAAGLAVLVSVARGVTLLVAALMGLAGGSVALATFIAIIVAIFFFIIGTFFKGKMKALKYKSKADEAEGAMRLAEVELAGSIKRAKAAAKAAGP